MAFILRVICAILLMAFTVAMPRVAAAQSEPGFSKSFSPATIGPGGVSVLTFTISNPDAVPVTDLAFTDNLPAGMTIASAPDAATTCSGGTISAPAGGTSFGYSGGALEAFGSCTLSVNVTAAAAGPYVNSSGDLTSSAGNSGPANATLTVSATAPGFSKSFSPAAIAPSGTSTLTYVIDASASGSNIFNATFTEFFPTGMTVASPANSSISCSSGTFVPVAGSNTVSLFSGFLTSGEVCTLSVDVTADLPGSYLAQSGALTSTAGNSGTSAAVLTVNAPPADSLQISKRFIDDPAAPGTATTLEFRLRNAIRGETATNVGFFDDLDAMLSGATAGTVLSDTCGGTGLGSGLFTYGGATLAEGAECVIRLRVNVPAGATPGSYPNVTFPISGTVGGGPVTGNAASDTLIVAGVPSLTKTFTTPSVTAGQIAVMEFTLQNTSASAPVSGISFSDNISGFINGATVTATPAPGFCGAGSFAFASAPSGDVTLSVTSASLAAGGSCSFSVSVQIPAETAGGTYTNTTSPVTSSAGSGTRGASAALTVNGGVNLQFLKDFTDDPVNAGDTVTLEYTIDNSEGVGPVTGLAFADDLGAMLAGAVAVGLPASNVCGAGSQISGTSSLSFTGGTLPAGGTCTFSVTVQVPGAAATGDYPGSSSALTGAGGVGAGPASATLRVLGADDQPVILSKQFIGGPFLPGQVATLQFTALNPNASNAATGISFTDNLGTVLSGLSAIGTPLADSCGAGSALSGTTSLTFSGGTLAAGASCTFSVDVQIPGGAASGSYINSTSTVTATVNSASLTGAAATAVLDVQAAQLLFSKAFGTNPVAAGGTTVLEFTIENPTGQPVSDLAFTDNLDAMLPMATAIAATANTCGGMATSGFPASSFSYAGGALAAGGSCTIALTVEIPAGTPSGNYQNVASALTGTAGGLPISGDPARASLAVQPADAPDFTKAFSVASVVAGEEVDLTFTIRNNRVSNALNGLAFTDDLGAMLPGAVATNTPVSACGGTLSGSGTLNFTGGTLAANTSCDIALRVAIPAATPTGGYTNTSSDLTESGLVVAAPASAGLSVTEEADLSLTLGDAPDPIFPNQTLTYTVEIANAGPSLSRQAGASLGLPAGVSFVSSTGCLNDPNGAPSCLVGDLAPGGSASFTVDVTVDSNVIGPLSATATAGGMTPDPVPANDSASTTTTVTPQADISITKSDGVGSIPAGASLTYTIGVSNAGPSIDQAVMISDTFPAGLICSYSFASLGGAVGGSSVGTGATEIADMLSMPAGSSATYSVNCAVTGILDGTLSNTATATGSVDDPDPANNSATDETVVIPPLLIFSKGFSPDSIAQGQVSTLGLLIDNSDNLVPGGDLAFTDTFPAGMQVATPPNATNSCGGTLDAVAGAGAISLSGGSVAPEDACFIQVDVRAVESGVLVNTSDPLTSSLPTVSGASATLMVSPADSPGFSKDFTPAAVNQGQVSTLSFVIDNTANSIAATDLAFTDDFPAGIEVAESPNLSSDCFGTLTANAGETTLGLVGGTAPALGSCTIEVDVVALGTGALSNTTSALTSSLPLASPASASLMINPAGAPNFTKDFTPAAVNQGQVSTLSFVIDNSANSIEATDLAFTDAFPAGMELAAAPNVTNDCGGTLTANAGETTLGLVGGTAPALGSCTIEVDVVALGTGALSNTTSALTSSLPVSGAATAVLTVAPAGAPDFTKGFSPDIVAQGGQSTLSFVIDNSANDIAATDLAFTDAFPAGMELAAAPNVTNDCGGTLTANAGETTLGLVGGTAPALGSCTIEVEVVALATGALSNTTSALTSSLPEAAAASATLTVTAAVAPVFTKGFSPAVIAQGEISVLSFGIDNSANSIEATDLAFTDAFPAGMRVGAGGLRATSCGGTLSAAAGDTAISLSGGTLAAGASCTIEIDVQGLTAGALSNTTSALASSLPAAAAASATLTVTANPLVASMVFAPDTVDENRTAALRYTLTNVSVLAATGIILRDTLPAGLVLFDEPGPSTTCSGGSFAAPDGGDSFGYSGGSLAPGASCVVLVSVISDTAGDYANSLETLTSSLGASAPVSATLSVQPSRSGTLTIVQETDTDGSYLFSSETLALNFEIETRNGIGQHRPVTLPAGRYSLDQTAPDGVGNTAITCDDDDSTGVAREGTLTVNLGIQENVTCTFVAIASRQRTVDTINSFLTKRADLILSSEPGNRRRIDRLNRGAGNASGLSFANGDLQSFLPFTARISTASESYSMSTSFVQMRQAAASLALAHGDRDGIRYVPNYRWDAWMEAQYKKFDSGNDTGHFAIAYFGADYLVNPDLLVGALFQVDDMEDRDSTLGTSVSGTGWMAGPYMTARLAPNLYFDGRVAAGQSTNDISPFNTYVDEFKTDRWLAMAGLTGEFTRGNWTIRPGASLSWFEEEQKSYVDSVGVLIPEQTVSLGQIKLGPSFTGQFETPEGMAYAPFFSIDAIYNFGDTSGVTITNPDTAATEGWRGRVQAGVDFNLRDGTRISFGGSYDGIGSDSLDIWGASFEITIPVKKPMAK